MCEQRNIEERKTQIRERYLRALDVFVEKTKQDPYVIAVILGGSLAYYDVGEDSNLDTLIIIRDDADSSNFRTFTEDGISIDALVLKRDDFKRRVEGILQGSFFHSFFSKGRLLYTRDESIREYIEESNYFGEQDRAIQLLNSYSGAFYFLYKTRKFLYIIGDIYGSYSFYMEMVRLLAIIEVIFSEQIPLREVIQQALKLNPTFFENVFVKASEMEKTVGNLDERIKECENYLDERMLEAYQPILEYLEEAGEPRTHQEIKDHITSVAGQTIPFLNTRELVRRGWVLETTIERRLTSRGKPILEEPAYLYDPAMMEGGEV